MVTIPDSPRAAGAPKKFFSRAGRASAIFLCALAGCSSHRAKSGDVAYVALPQVTVRDRVAAVYNKVSILKNGDRVEVLDHRKLFEKVRTSEGVEGWVEKRSLVGKEVYDGFAQLAATNSGAVVQAKGIARAELNMHVAPGRATETLYQLKKNDAVDILLRGSAEKPPAKSLPVQDASFRPATSAKATGPALEDWWLVRDGQSHVGWVYGRLLDFDVPLEIARYAENKRMVGFFVLNEAPTPSGKSVPQYLTLLTEPKEGLPYDYSQVRVFTWNPKRDRYETAFIEHKLNGVFPARVGSETFDKKEGAIPTFVLRLKTPEGGMVDRKYKMEGVKVRPVAAQGEMLKRPAKK